MTAPRHLWSGDWERETHATRRDEPRTPPAPTPPGALEPPEPEREGPARRRILIGLAALVLIGAAVLAAALTSGGGTPSTQSVAAVVPSPPTTPTAPAPQLQIPPSALPQPTVPPGTTPQRTPVPQARPVPAAGPTVRWNGMQIVTTGVGDVVVSTVDLSSHAEQAGVQPGDQILTVNGHSLNTAADIAAAIKGLPAKRQIVVQLVNGSASPRNVQLEVGAPPSQQS